LGLGIAKVINGAPDYAVILEINLALKSKEGLTFIYTGKKDVTCGQS